MTTTDQDGSGQPIDQLSREVATVKGQLTDLPEIKLGLARLRLDSDDVRGDVVGVSDPSTD